MVEYNMNMTCIKKTAAYTLQQPVLSRILPFKQIHCKTHVTTAPSSLGAAKDDTVVGRVQNKSFEKCAIQDDSPPLKDKQRERVIQ